MQEKGRARLCALGYTGREARQIWFRGGYDTAVPPVGRYPACKCVRGGPPARSLPGKGREGAVDGEVKAASYLPGHPALGLLPVTLVTFAFRCCSLVVKQDIAMYGLITGSQPALCNIWDDICQPPRIPVVQPTGHRHSTSSAQAQALSC
jgi:hypothetical protein